MIHKEIAQLCLDAYLPGSETWRSNGDTEVLLRTIDQVHVLATRGTEFGVKAIFIEGGWQDLLSDIRFVPWYDKRLGWGRKGFLRATQAIWPKIEEFILRPDTPIWLAGHSLGGAVSCYLAKFMIHYGKIPVGLTTFGCPKPAWGDLVKALQVIKRQDHFVNHSDSVTLVPPSGDHPEPRRLLNGRGHKMSEYLAHVTNYQPQVEYPQEVHVPQPSLLI